MVTSFSARLHTDLVLDELAASGLTVGDAQAPSTSPPYAILYNIVGATRAGPVADPDADVAWMVQVTCVGTSRREAQWQADQAESVLAAARDRLVDGRKITQVDPLGPSGVERDDTTNDPPLFIATPRFRLYSSPHEET